MHMTELLLKARWARTLIAAGMLGLASLTAGCEQKEKVLDIETPEGSIEVERSRDTGEIEIETEN